MTTPSPRKPRPLPRLRKQLLAVVDSRTTMVCLFAAGQIRELDEDFETLMGELTAPPFHIHCRSVAVPFLPGQIDEQRTAANAEIQARPMKEKRRGPDGFEGPLPPPAPGSAAVQVMRPRPDMTPPASGVRLPAARRDEIRLWSPSLAKLGRENRRGGTGRDPVLDEIARTQRFDTAPRVVREGQLERLARRPGAVVVWRGETGSDAAERAETLRTGPYVATGGIYGAGLQFTTSRPDAVTFAAGSGVVVHAVLVGEARTIGWDDLVALLKDTRDAMSANERRRYRLLLDDPGRFAAAMGYDAILLPDGEVLVLNRTALVVARS